MLIASGIAALLLLYVSSLDWRRALKWVLLLVIFEGVIRKWILPQASDQIIVIKDVVLLGAYIDYFFRSRSLYHQQMQLKVIAFLAFLVTAWCLIQTLNPRLGSPIAGMWGVKAYVYYIPIIWMIADFFKSKADMQTFLQRYLLLIIPVAGLGIAQFFSPSSSPINVYAGGLENTAGFADSTNTRITGTFSYLGGYSVYVMACLTLLIPLLLQPQQPLWRLATIFELTMLLATSFMTGSRTLIVYESLFLGMFLVINLFKQPKQTLKLARLAIVPITAVFILLIFTPMGRGYDAFINRALNSDSASDRFLGEFTAVTNMLNYSQFDGYGTGATHPAVAALRARLSTLDGEPLPYAEGEMGRIILELGPFGFLLWYALRIVLLLYMVRLIISTNDTYMVATILAVFLFHAINIMNHLVFNHTFSVYFWFLAGFILLVRKLTFVSEQVNTHIYASYIVIGNPGYSQH